MAKTQPQTSKRKSIQVSNGTYQLIKERAAQQGKTMQSVADELLSKEVQASDIIEEKQEPKYDITITRAEGGMLSAIENLSRPSWKAWVHHIDLDILLPDAEKLDVEALRKKANHRSPVGEEGYRHLLSMLATIYPHLILTQDGTILIKSKGKKLVKLVDLIQIKRTLDLLEKSKQEQVKIIRSIII